MRIRLLIALLLTLALAPVCAQPRADAAEIAFWESVRDSRNPAELQAYLQQYPNGVYRPLAEARLAALTSRAPAKPAPSPARITSTAPARLTAETRMPQSGDKWVYRLSYPRLRGQWGQADKPPSMYVVTVGSVSAQEIVDELAIDGGSLIKATHANKPTLATQGLSLFSPYLVATRDLPARGSLGSVEILDAPCSSSYECRATARVVGNEKVNVPAGEFLAIKVLVEEEWWGRAVGAGNFRLSGGRRMEVWYAPELKRAVRFASRPTVGDTPAVEPNFDLELISYQLK